MGVSVTPPLSRVAPCDTTWSYRGRDTNRPSWTVMRLTSPKPNASVCEGMPATASSRASKVRTCRVGYSSNHRSKASISHFSYRSASVQPPWRRALVVCIRQKEVQARHLLSAEEIQQSPRAASAGR